MATAGLAVAGCSHARKSAATPQNPQPLAQFDYGNVSLASEPHEKQLEQTFNVLMGLSEDSMLMPLRRRLNCLFSAVQLC